MINNYTRVGEDFMIDSKSFQIFLDYIIENFTSNKITKTNYYYEGLILDEYLEKSHFRHDYFSLEDYIYTKVGINYNDQMNLIDEFKGVNSDTKIKFIEAIYNLYNKNITNDNVCYEFCQKIKAMLNRNELTIIDDKEYSRIINSNETRDGYFCYVEILNDTLVRKTLKRERLTEENKKRFEYEYQMMEKLSSNSRFLRVYDFDAANLSYLMDRCECDLFEYLNDNILTENRKIKIILEILELLNYAALNGIIHRDLHLGNLLIKNNSLIIADFGLGKDSSIIRSLITSSGRKNNHAFISPEGFKNFKNVDIQSDIYSVGKIMDYIMGDGTFGKSNYILPIINKCLQYEKKDRYNNYEEIIIAINQLIQIKLNGFNQINILNNIHIGICGESEEKYIIDLVNNNNVSYFIIENKLNNFDLIFEQLEYNLQEKTIISIKSNYVDATGYGKFHNYDYFSKLSYKIILNNKININVKFHAALILYGCSTIRYSANDLAQNLKNNKAIEQEIKNILYGKTDY
jgi:serine/threonine protein kinase